MAALRQLVGRAIAAAAALVLSTVACADAPTTPRAPDGSRTLVLTSLGGDSQSGWPGIPLRDSLRVRVTDGDGVAVAGQPVTWSTSANMGHLSPQTSLTNEDGEAAAAWVLPVPTFLDSGTSVTLLAAAEAGEASRSFVATVTLGEWQWRLVDAPLELAGAILVDPSDDDVWYVWGGGLFVTHDAGNTWTQISEFGSRPGINRQGLVLDPVDTRRVFVSVARDLSVDGRTTLFVSNDRGLSWSPLAEFDLANRSIYVSPRDGAIYYAPQWPDTLDFNGPPTVAPGIFRSTDGGASFQHLPYGIPFGTQVLTWDIAEHPITGTLFLANEIADHPQPYHPPFLRSDDRGDSWQNVASPDWWHAQYIAVHPQQRTVYTLHEGGRLWKSTDDGLTWAPVGWHVGFSLLLDDAHPHRLYVGSIVHQSHRGGLSISADGGQRFWPIGFRGHTISGMALNAAGDKLHVAVFGSGVYVAEIPDLVP